MKTPIRLLAAAVTLAAVTIPGSAASAAPPTGVTPSTITWAPCAEDPTADCGTLRVPIDWARPKGPTFDLALARRKATDPSARIGSLVINPGGPGGSGVDFAIFGADYFSAELRRHFDLVGFDPRGVGRSHPVLCSLDLLAQQPSPELTSQADFDRTVAYNRQLAEDCRRNTGPLMDHVDTVSVVHDIDAIRAAVGDRRLSYYGVSYGTLMGEQYAELFPQRVRALALDSNMDHSLGTVPFLLTETATAQDSFNEFVKGCGQDPSCVLYGRDIRALWADLLARAGRGELFDPFQPDTRLTPFTLIGNAFGSFYGPAWSQLAEYLVAVDAQTPFPGLRLSTQERHAWAADPELVENGFQPVFCEDWKLPVRDYAQFASYVATMGRVAPDMRFSPLALGATVACLGWPSRVNNPQHPLRVQGSPTLMMVNALHDPATGYVWALNAHAQLGREARLLTYEGWGHGAYGRGDCVTGAVDSYLIGGTLPAPLARCAAVPPESLSSVGKRSPDARTVPAGPRPGLPGWS